jgi:hypothetical protein
MNNISKLLASSVVMLATSVVTTPLIAAGTESFNIAINTDETANNSLQLTSSIAANNTFNGNGTNYPLTGEMNLTGSDLQGTGCKLLFSSLNESDTNFRMKNNEEEYVNYALSINLVKNGSGNALARVLNRTGVGTTKAVRTDFDSNKGCSLTLTDFAINLEQPASQLTGIYQDTVTITASVI